MSNNPGVAANDPEWELEPAEGETLDPNNPEVLEARRLAGDITAPEA